MLSGVMEHFGFGKSLHPVVYYDSAYQGIVMNAGFASVLIWTTVDISRLSLSLYGKMPKLANAHVKGGIFATRAPSSLG